MVCKDKPILTNRIAIFDIVKFFLSLMVVAIHCELFPLTLYPWLRLAVPLFFVISSYLFFGNLQKCKTVGEKNQKWRKYVKRNIILYLFWLIVLLPYTLYIQQYFAEGVINGILIFTKSLLFGSTFPASWFIQALIVSVTIVFWASKRIKNRYLLVLSLLIYCFAIFKSSYWSLVEELPFLNDIYDGYELVFSSPVFNASSAFVWIVIGKIFAEKKIRISNIFTLIGGLMSAILLYAEWFFVRTINGSFNNDCYFFLIPTVFFLFQFVRHINLSSNKVTRFLGKCSTLVYTTHMPTITVVSFLCRRMGCNLRALIVFTIVAIICTLGSYIVLKIEKHHVFKWLKYSH